MAYTPITRNSAQNASGSLYLVVPPASATIAEQTIIASSLNVFMYGFAVNNTTGSAATLSITDGLGNKWLTGASFPANQLQVIPCDPGYYMANGIKLTSDTDDALKVWFVLKVS